MRRAVCLILAGAAASGARAQPVAPVRAEVAVREVTLSDGVRRYADGAGHVRVAERLVVGRRAQATALDMQPTSAPPAPAIFAGLAPYFAYSVLYDPRHGTVAFKPRPAAAQDRGAAPVGP